MDDRQYETPAPGEKIAVIDIGSNSVRLVVYDGLRRTPVARLNEKSMCALARGLGTSGRLNVEGIALAHAAIARFVLLARGMGVETLLAFATAAVRDATDGPDFIRAVEKRHSLTVTTLTGAEEAQLAASGLQSAVQDPHGLVGDLGGGSLELIRLHHGTLQDTATLPIGLLRLNDECGGVRGAMQTRAAAAMEEVTWLETRKFLRFYAIGGSFRAIAKLHMARVKYPLPNLHQYTLSREELSPLLRDILTMKPSALENLPGMSAKRVAEVTPAATVLDAVLRATQVPEVVFSTHGVREGALYEMLDPEIKREDPLLASAISMAHAGGLCPLYAQDAWQWMRPLRGGTAAFYDRIVRAACSLSEIAAHMHPESRGTWAFHTIIQSPLVGLSHAERVVLALILYHRYHTKWRKDDALLALIAETDRRWARVAGAALHLAYHLTGGAAGVLPRAALALERGRVTLELGDGLQELASDTVKKRLDVLGEAFVSWAKG